MYPMLTLMIVAFLKHQWKDDLHTERYVCVGMLCRLCATSPLPKKPLGRGSVTAGRRCGRRSSGPAASRWLRRWCATNVQTWSTSLWAKLLPLEVWSAVNECVSVEKGNKVSRFFFLCVQSSHCDNFFGFSVCVCRLGKTSRVNFKSRMSEIKLKKKDERSPLSKRFWSLRVYLV